MKTFIFIFIIGFLSIPFISSAQVSPDTLLLPSPDTSGGRPLMRALKDRKTTRSFADTKLPLQTLSNLMWAAFGINRPDGHRTAPSAMNWQEMDLYAAMENGVYRYNARQHSLIRILSKDVRAQTGMQDFVKDAPLTIVYVADLSKVKRASADDQMMYTGADCGFIAQNVYLYCASEGLACVVRGSIDRKELAPTISLRRDQKIILAQTVGYNK